MIFTADKSDFNEVLSLFNKCFESTNEFNDYFFNNIYKHDNTLVYKQDGRIVAMLQMLYYKASIGKVMYLFGVCTHENFRKQGLCNKLMIESSKIAEQSGCKAIILIPEHDYLYNFYAKFGYKSMLFCEQKTLQIEKNTANSSVQITALSEKDIDLAVNLYTCLIKKTKCDLYIERNSDFYKTQVDLYGSGAVKYTENGEFLGYSFGFEQEGKLMIDEIFAQDVQKCLFAHGKHNVRYKTNGTNTRHGMLKPLCAEVPLDGYINLLFN